MKKLFTILAAAVAAALCITSCNKEAFDDAASISSGLTVDIAVANPEGAETKAIKTSWERGDKLNIWFDGTYWNQLPQLVLTYDGARWNASDMDASILKSSGKFNVIYEASNSEFKTARNANYYYFPGQNVVISGNTAQKLYSVPLTCYQNSVAYTYSGGKLSAQISDWHFLTMLQVVITGLDKAADNYALKINNVNNTAAYYFTAATGEFKSSAYINGGYSVGVPNADGVAFTFGVNSDKSSRDIVFTLKERLSSKEYTFTKPSAALATASNRVKAIKLDASRFEGLPLGIDLGLSVRWATFNVGAKKPEDYGYFFAWGETEPKEGYDWAKEGDYKWGVYSNTASPKFGMTKYTGDVAGGDGLKTLQAGDDAATANWGSRWRTPTRDEINELLDKTKCEWTWDAAKKGYTVKSRRTGNSIFLPCPGWHGVTWRGEVGPFNVGTNGYYWSSTVHESQPNRAYLFDFGSAAQGLVDSYRSTGASVRPVTSY